MTNKKLSKKTQKNKVFEGIVMGLKQAINFAFGKSNKCTIHSPADIKKPTLKEFKKELKKDKEFAKDYKKQELINKIIYKMVKKRKKKI